MGKNQIFFHQQKKENLIKKNSQMIRKKIFFLIQSQCIIYIYLGHKCHYLVWLFQTGCRSFCRWFSLFGRSCTTSALTHTHFVTDGPSGSKGGGKISFCPINRVTRRRGKLSKKEKASSYGELGYSASKA